MINFRQIVLKTSLDLKEKPVLESSLDIFNYCSKILRKHAFRIENHQGLNFPFDFDGIPECTSGSLQQTIDEISKKDHALQHFIKCKHLTNLYF